MAEGAADGLAPQVTDDERIIERVTPEGLPLVYANNVVIRASVWDFTMDFGMILEADEKRLKFQDLTRVVMSPEHARVFAAILADHLKQYEEKFGRIPRPLEVSELGEVSEEPAGK